MGLKKDKSNGDVEKDIENEREKQGIAENIKEDVEKADNGEKCRFNFEEKPECSICMETYETGETVFWSKHKNCKHLFHEKCIKQWLLEHDDCPICRNNLLGTVVEGSVDYYDSNNV